MKYTIIGAGGTGGTIGAYMAKAEKDVTLIARGGHLHAIRKNGLRLEKLWDQTEEVIKVEACSMEEYQDSPDVIFVCVKGYSLESTIPFIRRIADENTIIIPIERDLVQLNLDILADLSPEATTSMQRDVMAGKESEMDGLIFEVVRLGKKYRVDMPEYQRAARKYGFEA